MKQIILALYLVNAIAVIVLVLAQGRGAGLGSAWGGSGESFSTRRGVEKVTFYATIGAVASFFVLSIASLLIQ